MLIHTIYRLLHYCKVAKIFKKSQKCTPLNSFKKLIPHIMKVGGSLYLLQNGMDDSPMCGNEFRGKFFRPNPNQLTC